VATAAGECARAEAKLGTASERQRQFETTGRCAVVPGVLQAGVRQAVGEAARTTAPARGARGRLSQNATPRRLNRWKLSILGVRAEPPRGDPARRFGAGSCRRDPVAAPEAKQSPPRAHRGPTGSHQLQASARLQQRDPGHAPAHRGGRPSALTGTARAALPAHGSANQSTTSHNRCAMSSARSNANEAFCAEIVPDRSVASWVPPRSNRPTCSTALPNSGWLLASENGLIVSRFLSTSRHCQPTATGRLPSTPVPSACVRLAPPWVGP